MTRNYDKLWLSKPPFKSLHGVKLPWVVENAVEICGNDGFRANICNIIEIVVNLHNCYFQAGRNGIPRLVRWKHKAPGGLRRLGSDEQWGFQKHQWWNHGRYPMTIFLFIYPPRLLKLVLEINLFKDDLPVKLMFLYSYIKVP